MNSSRHNESLIRQVIELLPFDDSPDPQSVIARLEQLQHGLEPENKFSLILSWLGKCRLVHKLGQEQLPLNSTDTYRIPDLLAAFDHDGKIIPVLIEVKSTASPVSLKPHYFRYAELLHLPMVIAWKHATFWTLFEMHHAGLATTNHKIDFSRAMEENLLGLLAGDISYSLAPGTEMQIRMEKLTSPDPQTGDFEVQIEDAYFVNPAGERVAEIPGLTSLFMFWENRAEAWDEGENLVQSFVVPEPRHAEFASRTLSQIVHAFAGLKASSVNWGAIIHDKEHQAHHSGRLQALVAEGARHGVITDVLHIKPHHSPLFL